MKVAVPHEILEISFIVIQYISPENPSLKNILHKQTLRDWLTKLKKKDNQDCEILVHNFIPFCNANLQETSMLRIKFIDCPDDTMEQVLPQTG